jgi:hypothetical protein
MRQKMAMGGTYDWDGPGILRSGRVSGCFMDDGVFDKYFENIWFDIVFAVKIF